MSNSSAHAEPKAPELLDWMLLLGLSATWGASFIMIKKAVGIFTPIQMTSWRMVLAFLVYIPVAIAFWSNRLVQMETPNRSCPVWLGHSQFLFFNCPTTGNQRTSGGPQFPYPFVHPPNRRVLFWNALEP